MVHSQGLRLILPFSSLYDCVFWIYCWWKLWCEAVEPRQPQQSLFYQHSSSIYRFLNLWEAHSEAGTSITTAHYDWVTDCDFKWGTNVPFFPLSDRLWDLPDAFPVSREQCMPSHHFQVRRLISNIGKEIRLSDPCPIMVIRIKKRFPEGACVKWEFVLSTMTEEKDFLFFSNAIDDYY